MTRQILIGIDIGTTSTKAVVFDSQGSMLAEAHQEYPTAYPHPNWAEQNPDDWWRALVSVVRRLRWWPWISKAARCIPR